MDALPYILGDGRRDNGPGRIRLVLVVAHDDPDDRRHVGRRHCINGCAITQIRMRLGQQPV